VDIHLTTHAHESLKAATKVAQDHGHGEVEPAHVLSVLLGDRDSRAVALLQAVRADVAGLVEATRVALLQVAPDPQPNGESPILSRATNDSLKAAAELARGASAEYLGSEHLLIGLAQVDRGVAPAQRLLAAVGATHSVLGAALPGLRGPAPAGKTGGKGGSGGKQPTTLDTYSTDLTARARQGQLDPVIGRDSEIRRLVQVLSRRTKNNPVLIGDPGVGKTAVVEGLAQRMIAGDVPESLRGKRLVSLDLTAMVAGAKLRGEFEERLKAVLEEIKDSAGEVVTFIDELHTVVGAGAAGDGAMDAGNMLKPMLARGQLRLVGATTTDEYRDHVEKDPALERRFQRVVVAEPSVEDTIGILRGLKERYEAHHKVSLADAALVAAATLSDRYIAGRQLPDKAIDLIDEAAARLRMEIDSSPEEIDALRRQVERLRMEKLALAAEADANSVARLRQLGIDMADRSEQLAALTARWEAEKAGLNRIGELREQLDTLRTGLERAYREGDWNAASRLEHQEIPSVERTLENAVSTEREDQSMLKEEVGADEVAEVVAAWTGIPAGRLLEGETDKLLRMESVIAARLIGQESAVATVSFAVRRARAGVADPHRPTGSFLFLGPSGVGKTELAKALADFLFDDEKAMVRLDMSEYGEQHSVSRLVGAPPGYIGYQEGGQLTEAVRQRPYAVVLLDEVEKAHPDVYDLLLQVLDDGRLTDSQGRTVNFRNVIMILTSNLGSQFLVDPQLTEEAKSEAVLSAVRGSFKPEFLNRLDDMVIFPPLGVDQLALIVDLQLRSLQQRMSDRSLTLEVTDRARTWLAETGYEPAFGARPLRRLIQREIGDNLATALLNGGVTDGSTVVADLRFDGDDVPRGLCIENKASLDTLTADTSRNAARDPVIDLAHHA
jgi:ATP-dependent Clp protease ATP-binding subunit ClpB